MENEGIIERAKESVRKHYNCNGEYPCHNSGDCEMCRGCHTPYDCCGCGAGDYLEGYIAGATEQRKIDIDERKQLEQIAITEEWLKEHGFIDTGEKHYARWEHHYAIRMLFDNNGSCNFSIEKSAGNLYIDRILKHNATIANLYDACELCGIELN